MKSILVLLVAMVTFTQALTFEDVVVEEWREFKVNASRVKICHNAELE